MMTKTKRNAKNIQKKYIKQYNSLKFNCYNRIITLNLLIAQNFFCQIIPLIIKEIFHPLINK